MTQQLCAGFAKDGKLLVWTIRGGWYMISLGHPYRGITLSQYFRTFNNGQMLESERLPNVETGFGMIFCFESMNV